MNTKKQDVQDILIIFLEINYGILLFLIKKFLFKSPQSIKCTAIVCQRFA